ncbi:MAG: hypothetical protein U0183_12200 [Polyangiaceae bacterium]
MPIVRRASSAPVLAALVALLVSPALGCSKKKNDAGGAEAGAAAVVHAPTPKERPADRVAPVALVAPVPLSDGPPLLTHAPKDPRGPKGYVDRAALRSLLYFKKYARLSAFFEEIQARFEKDPGDEHLVMEALDAFASADDALRAELDGWVESGDTSFAPYLARAAHHTEVGWTSRGALAASKTSAESFEKLGDGLTLAGKDADKALAIHPKLEAARVLLMRNEKGRKKESPPRAKALLAESERACPSCFALRFAYGYGRMPRWGGSFEELDAFAKTLPVEKRPELATIAGLSDYERYLQASGKKDLDAALASLSAASAHYDAPLFADDRAGVLDRKGDSAGALAAIDHALDLRPGYPEYLARRAGILTSSKRWVDAGRDLLAAVRVSRTNAEARRLLAWVVEWLVWEGWEKKLAGEQDAALDRLELALELAPTDKAVRQTHTSIVLGEPDPSKRIPALEAAVRDKPNDFRAHQALDYALARQGKYPAVITMWNGYLGRNPKDGRAYLERGGAYQQLGDAAASHADAKRACDLGFAEGCVEASRGSVPR